MTKYLTTGAMLGWPAATLAFMATWLVCIVYYGILGFALGWLPAMFAAWVVFGLTTVMWGPLLALVVLTILLLGHGLGGAP